MRTITDILVLTFLLWRASRGSVARRVSESVLFALFVLSILFRSSARTRTRFSTQRRKGSWDSENWAAQLRLLGLKICGDERTRAHQYSDARPSLQ